MKRCPKCKREKPLTQFANSGSSKDGKQSYCLICMAQLMRGRYRISPDKANESNRKLQEKIATEINRIKISLGCKFCPEKDPVCLDFHHLDQDKKEKDVSFWVRAKSLEKAREEISKCVCVCSNCHRKIHANLIRV